jgi:hypothetical protein
MKISQSQQILDYLKLGKSLTSLEALTAFGCLRLASRINDLIKQGYNIVSDRVEDKETGKHYSRYYLYNK